MGFVIIFGGGIVLLIIGAFVRASFKAFPLGGGLILALLAVAISHWVYMPLNPSDQAIVGKPAAVSVYEDPAATGCLQYGVKGDRLAVKLISAH